MKCPLCNKKNATFFLCKDKLKFLTCNECKVIFQENFEDKQNSPDYGKEAISHHYDFPFIARYIGGGKNLARFKRAQYNTDFFMRCLKQINYTSNNSSNSGVLDIGGGTGENLYLLKNTPVFKDTECILMERSRIDRDVARMLYGLNVVADFSQIAQKQFSVITIHHVLEHIPKPHEFINTIKTHLVDNGLVFLTMPDPFAWYPRFRKSKWGWFIEVHLVLYSMSACQQLLEQHGFQLVVGKRYFLDEPHYLARSIRSILSSIIRNRPLPRVLQDGYAQVFQMRRPND